MRLEQTCAACGGAVACQGVLPETDGEPVEVYACAACGDFWLVPASGGEPA